MWCVVNATPHPLYCRERDLAPIVQEAGGPQGWSERVREIPLPPRFDLRPVQHVVSCYTDYAITAHTLSCSSLQ
jgi:hypothetical protein